MPCSARREKELSAQGWRRQFTADEPRLSEAVEHYRQLGFEVHLEEVDPAACGQDGVCTSCFAQEPAAAHLKVIFTRQPWPKPSGG